MIHRLSGRKTENTILLPVLYLIVLLPFVSGAGSELDRFLICCLDRFVTVLLSRIRPVDTSVQQTPVLLGFYTSLFFYTIDLEVSPRVPLTVCLPVCVTACGLCAARFLNVCLPFRYWFPGNGLVKQQKKKRLDPFVFH